MKIKRIEANSFKRFTHLVVENIPATAKLIVLVGPNGSGKSSFLEAINYYYKFWSFGSLSDAYYIQKMGRDNYEIALQEWNQRVGDKVQIEFHDYDKPELIGASEFKGHFYFRSAYRNEPEINVQVLPKKIMPTESIRLESFIQNDMTITQNYQRLIAASIKGLYDNNNDNKSVLQLRNNLTGILKDSLERILPDLIFEGVGNPVDDGTFFFTKGAISNFNYKNLSAGEKATFDLLLDLVVQTVYYKNAVFCIDEPETHMHTKLQGKVLRELYKLIPNESQLIISTHSIGMLKEAEKIEEENPGTVVFLDFSDKDYDEDQVIRPTMISKEVQKKFYELAFGDFANLLLPETIVFCEGSTEGKTRKDFDKRIYSQIFEKTKPDVLFLSGGSCNDIENIESSYGVILNSVLNNSNVIKLVDRDDRSDNEIQDLSERGIKTLSRRNIESFLLDDELIEKLCCVNDKKDCIKDCLEEKIRLLEQKKKEGKPIDDLKNIRGEMYIFLKNKLNLTACGNNCDAFLRDTMANLVTEETNVYKIIESDIFN